MSVVTTTIRSAQAKIDVVLDIVSIDIRKEVNRIPHATLVLLDGDATRGTFPMVNSAYFEPGKEIEISLRYEETTRDVSEFKGHVVRLAVEASARGSMIRVEMQDAAFCLTQARKSTVFENKSDADVIKAICGTAPTKAGTIEATTPKPPQIVQYNCTDWDFILSRADLNGLVVIADAGEISARKVVMTSAPKQTFRYGMDEIYNLEYEIDGGSQYKSVESRGWDIEQNEQPSPSKADAFSLAQSSLDGSTLAGALGLGPYVLTHPVPLAKDELDAWANGRMRRNRLSMVRGRVSTRGLPGLKLLDVIEIGGIGEKFNGKAAMTGYCHRIDSDGWRTDLQFGLSSRPFALEENITAAAAAGQLPGVAGIQLGVVTDYKDDPDKQLRVKVKLPALNSDDPTVWARLASPDAGKNRGWFFRPEIGDDVVIGFLNEDPRYPVILGALYSSKNAAPPDFDKITQDNLKKGIVTKSGTKITFSDEAGKESLILATKAKNTITLDDDKKQIEIADQHGNTVTMDDKGITLVSKKDITLKADGKVTIKGAEVNVN